MNPRQKLGISVAVVVVGLLVAGVVIVVATGRQGGKPVSAGPKRAPTETTVTVEPTTSPTTSTGATTTSVAVNPIPANPVPTVTTAGAPAPAVGRRPAIISPVPTAPTGRGPGNTGQVTTATTAGPPPSGGNNAADALNALNQDRISQGLPALRTRSDLQAKAQAWADKMVADSAFYHSNLGDGLQSCWTRLAENLGAAQSVTQAEQVLMNDPPHRVNLLGAWDWVGVGVGVRPSGQVVVVQDFMAGCR